METKRNRNKINLIESVKMLSGIVAVLRILVPSFDALYKEEKMAFLSAFDLLLLFWVPVLIVFGQWLKKRKLPVWMLPTPILIILASFLICGVAGAMRINAEGSALYAQVVWYAIANGCLISFVAICLYDCWKGICSTTWVWLKTTVNKFIAKRKEGKKA